MGETLSSLDQEQIILQERRLEMVNDVMGRSANFRKLSDEARGLTAGSLVRLAQSLEDRYSGNWNGVRWGTAWIEMIEDGDESLSGAFQVCNESDLLGAFKKMFHMYEAGVSTLEGLRVYKEMTRIKAPHADRAMPGKPTRSSKRSYRVY
jgi:hypothetical protein